MVISSRADYVEFHNILKQKDGTEIEDEDSLHQKLLIFHRTDSIFSYFDDGNATFKFSMPIANSLRYGENPSKRYILW